jgi:hypothetical protein
MMTAPASLRRLAGSQQAAGTQSLRSHEPGRQFAAVASNKNRRRYAWSATPAVPTTAGRMADGGQVPRGSRGPVQPAPARARASIQWSARALPAAMRSVVHQHRYPERTRWTNAVRPRSDCSMRKRWQCTAHHGFPGITGAPRRLELLPDAAGL